jgi:formate hydrogenlyase subunit 6/NADH:ubiquinone oxidoreductase subunit I
MNFPKCTECEHVSVTDALLAKHQKVMHPDNENQHCIYCNKVFSKELPYAAIYSHMRSHHKEKAREDGVMDFSDEETYAQDENEYAPQQQAKKIDILSNISLLPPMKGTYVIDSNKQIQQMTNITLAPSSKVEAIIVNFNAS